MALATVEPAPPTSRIRKQYRLLYRSPDGSACLESVDDPEGHELLSVYADGSTLSEIIVGLCGPCAFGDGCGRGDLCLHAKSKVSSAAVEPVPESEPERDDNVRPFRAFGPKDSMNDRLGGGSKPAVDEPPAVAAARELACLVWNSQQTLLSKLNLKADDPVVVVAVAHGWLRVTDDGAALVRGSSPEPRPPTVTAIPNDA